MSKHLAELCTLLVDSFYGELASRIIATLLLHGRLAVFPLCELCNLNPRYVKNGLATLIQQRLVHHFTSEEGLTVYEADIRNAYELIRYGKATQLIANRYGPQAAELVSILQDRGFAVASEILELQSDASSVETSSKESQTLKDHALPNGISKSVRGQSHRSTPLENRLQACRQLFASRHVVNLRAEDFLSATDYHDFVEHEVRKEKYDGEVKGAKKMKEFAMDVLKRKRRLHDSNIADPRLLEGASQAIRDTQSTRGQRRRASGADLDQDEMDRERSNKRRKIDKEKEQKSKSSNPDTKSSGKGNVGLDSQLADNSTADSSPTFRVNREKFDVSIRSQYLVDLSARFLGETTSKVYNALLRRLERNIPRCHDEYSEAKKLQVVNDDEEDEIDYDSDEEREVTATSMEAEEELDSSVDVQSMFTTEKPAKVDIEIKENGHNTLGDEAEPQVNGVKDHRGMNETMINRQKRVGSVEQHLRLLAEHSFKFLTRVSARGQGTWTINFDAVCHSLIQLEIDNLVNSRFGPTATRIIRILHSKGKLDEKQIGSIGLIRQKDLRRVLTLMQEAGFVDTQEVPRDNTRQPSRTIYLWFYDQERCRKLILNDTYKSMSRLLQRAKVEKEKVQAVIDKAERTDVKGQEDKYLSKAEKDALANWRTTEQKLLVQLSRQDDLVAIFRDFLPLT